MQCFIGSRAWETCKNGEKKNICSQIRDVPILAVFLYEFQPQKTVQTVSNDKMMPAVRHKCNKAIV